MTEAPAKVSIVIPTFNRAEMLDKAIRTSLDQTVPCEVIVANHGSSDNTDEVVAAYGDRVRYVRREEDFGPHFAWLDGVMHARTEYVHFQYDDDWIKPEYIESCLSLMTPRTGFVFSAVELFDDDTQSVDKVFFQHWLPKTGVYPQHRLRRRLERRLISPGAVLFRKTDVIDGLYQGGLPLSKSHYHGVGPDHFLTLLCLLRYPDFGFVREPLAVFRKHSGSITISARAEEESSAKFTAAYREVRRYYRELKAIRMWRKLLGTGR